IPRAKLSPTSPAPPSHFAWLILRILVVGSDPMQTVRKIAAARLTRPGRMSRLGTRLSRAVPLLLGGSFSTSHSVPTTGLAAGTSPFLAALRRSRCPLPPHRFPCPSVARACSSDRRAAVRHLVLRVQHPGAPRVHPSRQP